MQEFAGISASAGSRRQSLGPAICRLCVETDKQARIRPSAASDLTPLTIHRFNDLSPVTSFLRAGRSSRDLRQLG